MNKKLVFILFISLLSLNQLVAQDKSNRGKEFWLGYGFNYNFFHESPANSQELALYISAELATTVTITISNTGYSQILNIPANTVDATILIPKSGVNDARVLTDGLNNKGIRIVSTEPIAVYSHCYAPLVSGATMLMPIETYGFVYYSINYSQATSNSSFPSISPTTANGADWYSWFYVIAPEDNTRIEITPSDTTKNGWLPGQTYTVNLNKGEMYHVFGKLVAGNSNAWAASKDMTGSKVVSITGADSKCHPIAMFSGSGGIRICRGDGGEFMQQQIFPAQAWGTRYLTYHTINNTNTDILETNRNYYRICVQDPSTVVKRNGTTLMGITRNFYYEIMDSTGGDYITADKPIMVSQYTVNKNQCWNFPTTTPSPPSYGDPEMFYLSPIEQGQKAVRFYASRKSTIDYVYANIHFRTAATNSLLVDGNAVPAANIVVHPNFPSYSVALTRFTGVAAQHTITCDSAFTSTVYGLGNFESYGYNVGTLVNNLNSYSSIENTFSTNPSIDSFSCPKTPFKVFVKLGFPASNIHWKFSQVAGITPNTDSIITNPVLVRTELINNRTYYVYSLQQNFTFANAGTYYIPVTYGATVLGNCSQSENATIKVVVKPGPTANFTFTNAGCLKDTVQFVGIANYTGSAITQYLWNFDDNTTAATINTNKKFNSAGTQNVRFRIYAENGCAGDTTKQITINHTPTAKLGATAIGCAKDSLLISDTSTIAAGTITNWYYSFGDGNTLNRSVNTNFRYTYNLPGNYTLKLVTTSNNNCISDTSFKPISINPKPQSKFGISGNVCIGDSIRFTDSSTIITGSIVSWRWYFSNGQSLIRNTNSPFFYTFTAVGNYVVKLVTESALGCASDTFEIPVSVNTKPVVSFTFLGKPCIDSVFRFTSSIAVPNTGIAPNWYWSFGNTQTFTSNTSNIATTSYTSLLSNIIVKHVVSYGPGCSNDTSINTIPIINANPSASVVIIGDTLCENKNIEFSAMPNPNINQWVWQLGTFTSNSLPPLNYSFNNAGNYLTSLKVFTTAGCGSTPFTQNITINSTPLINAGLDKTIISGTSTTLDATIANPNNYNFNWMNSNNLSSSTVLNPIANPTTNTTYIIEATDKVSFCKNTDTVKIIVVNQLSIPNAFSPNGDGINDVWEIQGLELYPDAIVSIFNRGGQLIFEKRNYRNNLWNGTINGKPLPVGTYYYMIKLTKNNTDNIAGSLLLIK